MPTNRKVGSKNIHGKPAPRTERANHSLWMWAPLTYPRQESFKCEPMVPTVVLCNGCLCPQHKVLYFFLPPLLVGETEGGGSVIQDVERTQRSLAAMRRAKLQPWKPILPP